MLPSSTLRNLVEHRGVEPRLTSLRSFGQVRNSHLPALPFGRLLCSPGFHIAFAYGEQFRILKGRLTPLEQALLSLSDDSFASFRLRRQPTGLAFGSFPTGGARLLPFAQWSFKSLGAGLALPFALTNSGRFLLRRTAHWADASFVCPAFAVTSAKALTACAWQALPKSKIWTLAHLQCFALSSVRRTPVPQSQSAQQALLALQPAACFD